MTDYPETGLYIDGVLRPAEGRRTYEVIAPATGKAVGRAADGGAADMDAAIAAARHAFDETDWSHNLEARIDWMTKLQARLEGMIPDWRERVSAETGATMGVVNAVALAGPIEMMKWTIGFAKDYEYERDIGVTSTMGVPSRRIVVKEAAGVVGAITPWNVPMQINLAKLVAALSAGCTAVLKPAPDTPWSAMMLGEAAHAIGLPKGVLNIVTSGSKADIGEQLVTDPRVDIISFTGSTATGKRIMAAAAPTLKRVFLELGGKSANIVLDDATFPDALMGSVAVCYHAGQGCALPTRILLPRSRYDEAIEVIRNIYESLPYGDPSSTEQILGPVVSKAQFDRVSSYIELGEKEGARLVTGGPVKDGEGYYIRPTLFADVRNDMRIAQEEIFGPVLVAIPHDGDDDAVRIANESVYGLSGAVQSADPKRAMAVARRIRTGTVNINAANAFAADAPFGGYKQSGVGREMGAEGFEEYLETKTIAIEA